MIDPRWPGEMRQGAEHISISYGTTFLQPPVLQPVQWENTSGNPVILFSADDRALRIQAGAFTNEAALAGTCTHTMLHDDGSGVQYLYYAFGGDAGSSQKIQRRNRAGTITQDDQLVAGKMLSLSNAFYGTRRPSGGTAECGVYKVTGDPFSATLPAPTIVGWASTSINNLVAVHSFPIALKPEGIFVYDSERDEWRNLARSMEASPHVDNGKRFFYEGDAIVVCLGNGGAVRCNGYDIEDADFLPVDRATPNERTTPQIAGAAGAMRHWGFVATQPGGKRQRSRIIVKLTRDDGSTFSTLNNVIDGDPSTTDDVSNLNSITAPVDWLAVGADHPFIAVRFAFADPNSNASTTIRPGVLRAAGWSDFLTSSLYTDLTSSWRRDGWIIFNHIPGASLLDADGYGWTKQTLDGQSRYWWRFKAVDAAVDASVLIKSIDVLPLARGLNDGIDSDSDASGSFPHLIATRLTVDGRRSFDMGRITEDDYSAILYGDVGVTGLNDEKQLMVFGRQQVHVWPGGLDDRPGMFSWPRLHTQMGVEFPMDDLDGPGVLKAFVVDGIDFNGVGRLSYQYDDNRPWRRTPTFTTLPAYIPVSDDHKTRSLRVALSIYDENTGTRPGAIRLMRIDALIEEAPDGESITRLSRAEPPLA